jgi:hypothetical protein
VGAMKKAIYGVCVLLILAAILCFSDWALFVFVQNVSLPTAILCVAESHLSNSRTGIRLATRAPVSLGGNLNPTSSQILFLSTNKEILVEELSVIVTNTSVYLGKRVSLIEVLWRQTEDSKWMLELFNIASGVGSVDDVAFARARRILVGYFDRDYLNIEEKAELRLDHPIPMTKKEFEACVYAKYGNLK